MDIQRYLLIGAAAALAVMLLGEWTAFKAERAEPMARERLMEQTATPTNGSNDLPKGQVEQAVAVEEDVPVVTLAGDEQASELTPAPASLVTVTTNTLEVVIDLVGGDIIEAALPQFPEAIDQPDEPFVLLEQNTTRTYVAQSGLVGTNGIDSPDRAVYTSDKTAYQNSGTDPLTVSLFTESKDGRVTVEKRFTFTPGSYAVDVAFVVTNQSAERWTAVPFAQLKRDDTLPPSADSSGFGMQPFLGAATTTQDDRFRKFSFDDIEDDPWKGSLQGGWIALLQHYFVTAWIPNAEQTHNYSTRKTGSGFNIAGLTSAPLTVAPGSTNQWTATLYVGPKDQYVLENLSPYLDLTVDYGWLWWIAKPLFWLLTLIQGVVINWGLAIILLTILVKAAFFQLSATSYKSMAKMRKIQPKVQALREQYPDDKQKQSQAMMDLYRKEKINPMGGCLPILIQMPVFIALYWVLMESVELRQAPFALWIKDLSAADPYFVLPLMMGASMFFMQKLNPPPPDPMQAKIMQWLPIVFTFFFLWFPAGLVLYWVVNNLLSMAQQWVITRSIERQA